jgi:diguanylate cyclase (GGDEF)-like protein
LNDTFGHEAGDSALRVFSEVVRDVFRADDHPARWGGEEFAAIIPGLLAQDAVKVVDRLRASLAEALLATGSHPFTASFGVADTTMTRTFDQLVRIADDALYLSKDGGRDRATVGDPQRVTPNVPRRPSEHVASIDLRSISKLA